MHTYVYSSAIDNSQSMERAQMSINGWMDKEDVICVYIYIHIDTHTHTHIHAHNGTLLDDQKVWNIAIYNNMDGTRVYYAKRGKSEKGKYHMTSLICGI